MSRLASCLFFIAILHNGILKVAHADETITEGLSKTNEEEEVKPKPIVVEDVEEGVSLKLVPQAKSAEPAKVEPREGVDTVIQTAAAPIAEKDTSDRDGNIEDKFFEPPIHMFKSIPIKHTQVLFEIPGNALSQSTQALNVVGEQIGAAVAKTFNTVKYLATAPFGLLRSAVNSAVDYE